MKKPDFDYYSMVVSTQNDPDILQRELKDLINESVAYIETASGSKVPCSVGVMPYDPITKKNYINAVASDEVEAIEYLNFIEDNEEILNRIVCRKVHIIIDEA